MNLSYSRNERVAELIHREVSQILLREVSDPRLQTLTITRVKVSPDLKLAKIFVTSLKSKEEKDEVLKGLKSAHNFIRRAMGQKLELRVVPEIAFNWDDSVEYSMHINEVIADLKNAEVEPVDDLEDGDDE